VSIGDTDFGVQVGIGFLGRAITALVALIGSIFLARVLGPAGYGSFYLTLTVVRFLDNPITGWSTACRKRFTQAEFPATEALGSLVIGAVGASMLVGVLAFVFKTPLATFTGLAPSNGWILFSVLFFAVVAYKPALEMAEATANFGVATWTLALRDVVRVLAQAVLVVTGLGVAGMVGGMIFAYLLMLPLLAYLIATSPAWPSGETLAQIWAFARSSIPNGILSTAQDRMDILLLGVLATQGAVGNYEVALRITTPALFVAGVASSGLLGRVSNRLSRDKSVTLDIERNISYASIIAIPLFVGAVVIGRPVVVTLYSSQFVQAGALIAGLALYQLLASQRKILAAVIDGYDRPELNLRTSTLSFALNVGLGVVLFSLAGVLGIVIATVLSEGVSYLVRAYYLQALAPEVCVLPRPLLEQAVSGLVMGVSVLGVRTLTELGSWLTVLMIVLIGGVVYFVVLVGISKQFRGTAVAVAQDSGLY